MAPALQAGLGARDVHAWDRLSLAVANPGAVDLEAGMSQMGACACGVLLPGQGGRQVLHVPPDPNPCTTAGPQSLQTWVLLSMRPAKPGDCFRGISGILCSDSLWHERVKAEWLRQSLCVPHYHFSRVCGGWFSPWWCLYVPGPLARLGWAGPRLGWAGARHSTCAARAHLPRKLQRKVSLCAVGQIIPEGSGTDLVQSKEQ